MAGFHCIGWLHKHWIVTRRRIHCTNGSITPEVFESIRCQLGIAGGVLDVAVSEVLLDRTRILPVVGQFVSCGVAQHVWVNLERDAGFAPSPVDDLAYCIDGERSLALADKHVGRVRVVPLQSAQGAQLGPPRCWRMKATSCRVSVYRRISSPLSLGKASSSKRSVEVSSSRRGMVGRCSEYGRLQDEAEPLEK